VPGIRPCFCGGVKRLGRPERGYLMVAFLFRGLVVSGRWFCCMLCVVCCEF